MAVPDTTPVTGVLPASPIPTVTFPTSPAPMAVRLTTVVRSARPASPTRIAVRRRFPVTTAVPQPTPAVSAPLVRAIRIVTCPINLVTADALPQTPVANALPASPVRLRTLVPAFPAALTLTAPVVLVTATPGITSRVLPVLKTRYILTATLAHQGTAAQTLGEVRLRRRPRPVLAVLLQEPVTKPRRIPTVTPVRRALKLPVARPLRFRPGQLLRFALVALLPAPATPAVPRPALMAAIQIPQTPVQLICAQPYLTAA